MTWYAHRGHSTTLGSQFSPYIMLVADRMQALSVSMKSFHPLSHHRSS